MQNFIRGSISQIFKKKNSKKRDQNRAGTIENEGGPYVPDPVEEAKGRERKRGK